MVVSGHCCVSFVGGEMEGRATKLIDCKNCCLYGPREEAIAEAAPGWPIRDMILDAEG
ncbi:hypothetical protein GCM10017567_40040 [Amycolatopsis bullii]|uniref:Uncharacterized protein n=1 Tax=Amycolatopsis bullii TaxID=941987 RepID=A0ABQ3KDV3_9PSEU|nr:hypothetical protein GCM10017567_40040 [Amycolatopsis bullii]